MDKRQFISFATFGLGTLIGSPSSLASYLPNNSHQSITVDQVRFSWRHNDTVLLGSLSAPTSGWIAVGFNEKPGLRNTRFIIANTSISPVKAEEHIALIPDHKNIKELGLSPALQTVGGSYSNGHSNLDFEISHIFTDRPTLSLAPGTILHVMLAWSRSSAFDHHSAWRKHFQLKL